MSSPSGNSNKPKSGTVANVLLKRYLLPLLEANGWTVERKTRSGEGSNPHHIDWYFFPPGVIRGHGNKLRVDFFDSTTQVLNYLKWDTGSNLSQFVHSFFEKAQEISKAEGKALAKLKATNYDRFLEVITSKVNIPLPTDIHETEEFTSFWSRSHSRLSPENFENSQSVPNSSSPAAGKKRKRTSSETSKKEKKKKEKMKSSEIIGRQRPDAELRSFPSVTTQENIEASNSATEMRVLENIRRSIEHDNLHNEKEQAPNNNRIPRKKEKGGLTSTSSQSTAKKSDDAANLTSTHTSVSRKISTGNMVSAYSTQSRDNLQTSTDVRYTTDDFTANIAGSRGIKPTAISTTALGSEKIPRKDKTASLPTFLGAKSTKDTSNSASERTNNKKALSKSDATDITVDNKYYLNFQQKLQAVRDIEFKGLHGQTVNKIMWKQHKLLFGKTCDDSCLCPSNLKDICKNVVTSARQSAIDKGDEAPQVVCAGFVTCFAPRYYKALCRDFPQDCPAKILRKLLEMWKLHKKKNMYGETCGPLCGCDYAYFSNIILPSPPENSLVQDKPLAPPPSPPANRIEYSVTFDSSIPLGFYTTGLSSCCRIASVNPFRVDLDRRLLRGTEILATETAGVREELLSHLDLKSRYCKAQERREKLTIWFLNHNTVARSNYVQKKQWSRTGAWQGITDDGWAGGADLISKGHNSKVSEKVPPVASDTASSEENDFLTWSVQKSSAKKHPSPNVSVKKSS